MSTGPRRVLGIAGRLAVVGLAVTVDLTIWAGDRQLRSGASLPYAVIPVAIVAVHITLLLRHRYPRLVLAGQSIFASVGSLAVPQLQPVAGLLVVLYAVASRRSPRESAPWLVALAAVFGVHAANTAVTRTGDAEVAFAFIFCLWMLIATTLWAAGSRHYLANRRAWRIRELQAAEAADTIRAERLRLARELHDIVSHGVTGMMLQAAGAQALTRPTDERLSQALTVIETTGVQALSELHRMLGLLRAADPQTGPEAAEPGPTVADITTLVRLAEDAGRDVRLVEVGSPGPLDPSVATAAYRVVQEALTNTTKHGGPAATVVVELRWRAAELLVTISDRSGAPPGGAGREVPSCGLGLVGLTERVRLTGGAVHSGPTPEGYALTASLPRPVPSPALVAVDAVS